MDLTGKIVNHKKYGEGKIIEFNGEIVKIDFDGTEKKFTYPGAFEKFLTADEETMEQISKDMDHKKIKERLNEELITRRFTRTDVAASIEEEKLPEMSVAYKCNYCDGGRDEEHLGFLKQCSHSIIKYNINEKVEPWCCDENSICRQFLDEEISIDELEEMFQNGQHHCYESSLLREWKIFEKKPVNKNSLCILTTREPQMPEKDRFIFAIFLVDDNTSKYRVVLSPKEAHQMLYWLYKPNEEGHDTSSWGDKDFMYMDNKIAVQILRDIVYVKKNETEKHLAKTILERFCKLNGINEEEVDLPEGGLIKF